MLESKNINKGCCHLSRHQIIAWINQTLILELTTIEQLGTGSVYCQLLDSLYPGRVPLHKVNWKAKFEYEFTSNYKILQAALDHLGIQKQLDVEKLIKCKSTSNLEIIQWLKRFIDNQGGPVVDYDPISRRGRVQVDFEISNTKKPQTKNKQNFGKTMVLKSLTSSIPSIKLIDRKPRSSFKPMSSNRLNGSNTPHYQSISNYVTKRTMYSLADIPFIDEDEEII